jgi:hypothetical protein
MFVAANSSAQSPVARPTIQVSLTIDGAPAECNKLHVELRVGNRKVPVEKVDHGFIVPPLFSRLYASPRIRKLPNISAQIQCSSRKFEVTGIYPAQVEAGTWALGVGYPSFWVARQSHANALGLGTWVSYVDFETNDCEPCIEIAEPHKDLPQGVVDRTRTEQATATGEEAVKAAFQLAVFDVDYARNRDYLSSVLGICLASPDEAAIDDVCNKCDLLLYLETLYWRGDTSLLRPLLNVADSRAWAVDDAGTFYADLLDQRNAEALRALDSLPIDKQRAVCRQAGKEALSMNPPKEERVLQQLQQSGGEVAERCLQEAKAAADNVPWRKDKK